MIRNVEDLPLWEDCPYRTNVPVRYDIRAGDGVVCFIGKAKYGTLFHVDMKQSPLSDEDILAVVNNLAQSIFENDHPGESVRLLRAKVNRALSDNDKHLLQYQNELGIA